MLGDSPILTVCCLTRSFNWTIVVSTDTEQIRITLPLTKKVHAYNYYNDELGTKYTPCSVYTVSRPGLRQLDLASANREPTFQFVQQHWLAWRAVGRVVTGVREVL